jgi:LytS/YehU family sensor histidine kinase
MKTQKSVVKKEVVKKGFSDAELKQMARNIKTKDDFFNTLNTIMRGKRS